MKTQNIEQTEAYKSGYFSAKNVLLSKKEVCPYPFGTLQYKAWLYGYMNRVNEASKQLLELIGAELSQ